MAAIRCFAGIPLPECMTAPVLDACEALRRTDHSWRDEKWVAENNLHVTLHFMGAIDESVLPGLLDALDEAVVFDRFELPVRGIEAVPSTHRCRMLWATFLDPDGACAHLAEEIQRAALPFGVAVEERSFRPHATLCRARRSKPLDPSALAEANDVFDGAPRKMSVGRATLFTSRLSPRGPVYSALRDWHARGE